MTLPLLMARGLVKRFPGRRAGDPPVVAVAGADLTIRRGEVVGLVGESGSGKTTLGKSLLRIIEPDAGELRFDGVDLRSLDRVALCASRARMQMIYQSAAACLNPGLTVEQHLLETIRLHKPEAREHADELIDRVLGEFRLDGKRRRRPGELSGGERRRVGVARCLLPRPSLVIADEPTAGLDASVKADILGVMMAARREHMAYVFISHELDVVRYVSHRVVVMYRGHVVQEMPAARLDPRGGAEGLHPYTERLLLAGLKTGSLARPQAPVGREPGPGAGCPYRGSCHRVGPGEPTWERCRVERPRLVGLSRGGAGVDEPPNRVACHLATDLASEP